MKKTSGQGSTDQYRPLFCRTKPNVLNANGHSVNPCFSAEIGNEYNIRVQFKNWLAKSNTGLYESSYIDEVCS